MARVKDNGLLKVDGIEEAGPVPEMLSRTQGEEKGSARSFLRVPGQGTQLRAREVDDEEK